MCLFSVFLFLFLKWRLWIQSIIAFYLPRIFSQPELTKIINLRYKTLFWVKLYCILCFCNCKSRRWKGATRKRTKWNTRCEIRAGRPTEQALERKQKRFLSVVLEQFALKLRFKRHCFSFTITPISYELPAHHRLSVIVVARVCVRYFFHWPHIVHKCFVYSVYDLNKSWCLLR